MDKRTIGIIASGPSATKEDAEKLQKICDSVICVNDSWKLLPSCDCLYGTDMKWWKYHHANIARDYRGVCYTQDIQWTEDPAQWGIKQLKSKPLPGLSTTPGLIHTGGNSGYAAIGLAFGEMGADIIILMGFDMMMDGTRRHWFGDHPTSGMNVNSNYNNYIQAFGTIDPAEYGIEILNCTRRTRLVCFPQPDLDDLCAA